MGNVIEVLVKAMVDSPEQAQVNVIEDEEAITYEVRVADEDLGKVIGRSGKIANALRTVAKAAALKHKKKAFVEILSD